MSLGAGIWIAFPTIDTDFLYRISNSTGQTKFSIVTSNNVFLSKSDRKIFSLTKAFNDGRRG